MRVALFPILAALIVPVGVHGEMVEWPVSEGGNGHFYEAVRFNEDVPRTWARARLQAHDRGGYLATVTSAEENAFVVRLISHPMYWSKGGIYWEGPWIGGFQRDGSREPDGGWRWVTKEEMTYQNWHPGLPDNLAYGPYHQDTIHYWGRDAETLEEFEPMWDDVAWIAGYVPSYVVEYDEIVRVGVFSKDRRRFPPRVVHIRGYSSALGGIRQVKVWLNSRPVRQVAGTTRWSVGAEFRPGRNTIRTRAIARDGRVSRPVTVRFRASRRD